MGFIGNWYKTAKEIILRPVKFFKNMSTDEGHRKSLKFAAFNFFIGSLLSAGYTTIFNYTELQQYLSLVGYTFSVHLLISIFGNIVKGIIGIYILSLIMHIFLKLAGAKNNLIVTFRVIAYITVVNIFSWLVVIDSTIATLLDVLIVIYVIYLMIVAFKEVHEISQIQAVIAIGMPMIILMMIGFFISVLSLGSIS